MSEPMTTISNIRSELRYLIRELGLLDKNCLNSNLSLSQAHILTYVHRNGSTSFHELAIQLNVQKASLSRTLTTLIDKEYLSVELDPADKRQKIYQLLPDGEAALQHANQSADTAFAAFLEGLETDQLNSIENGLRTLRLNAFKSNFQPDGFRVKVERLSPNYQHEVDTLIKHVFNGEQGIPEELIPLDPDQPYVWWVARCGEYVIGAVACWEIDGEWHWGRYFIDANFRGFGIGKKLAAESLSDIFANISDYIVSDARDTTVAILTQLGAEVTGKTVDFYGAPVTPMKLYKQHFLAITKP
ncbi:GNAT family N-acetyltransferase [Photobacterium rosenbergii]|uniref:GNAT family N-acetyltransferase n=1 Tax=Photobacterium rosenbergii TaxID=294936 RepID=A0ABU3ZHX9_9GAMM|nr:GNAT family N-acetyltransferase [Photobacterium rosenbergii]MDV5169696.1 GNAT family N-acetyltransferase [Photobacterium rosenbergii]